VLEIGASQGPRVAKELATRGYYEVSIYPDLAGRARVAEGRHA
jgi:hypothetical protein